MNRRSFFLAALAALFVRRMEPQPKPIVYGRVSNLPPECINTYRAVFRFPDDFDHIGGGVYMARNTIVPAIDDVYGGRLRA